MQIKVVFTPQHFAYLKSAQHPIASLRQYFGGWVAVGRWCKGAVEQGGSEETVLL